MSIEESAQFEVVKTEKPLDETPRISICFIPTGNIIETIGAVLEAQYSIGDNYILFVSEGTPYEEALHISLVDSKTQIVDSVEISAEYTSGMFRNVSVVQPNKVFFAFFEQDEKWCLEVLRNPKTKLWANRYPIKRESAFLHRTYLDLEKS